MRKLKKRMLAAILICGTTMALTSCGKDDGSTLPKSYHLIADE